MKKITFTKPGTMLYPLPAVMVSCGDDPSSYNIVTVAWTGTVNTDPPIVYISLRKSRHSHGIISRTREFVINLTSKELLTTMDFCGVKSGRDTDKFKTRGLTPLAASVVHCPMIAESPVNLECKVRDILEFPSHDMFIADVVAVHATESLMDEKGKLHLEKAGLITFSHGAYYDLAKKPLGTFGYSVKRRKTKPQSQKKPMPKRSNKRTERE